MTVNLRAMHGSDLPACHLLTQKLGWSHRLEDWQEGLLLGQGLVAIVEDKVVGSILYWRWGSQTATVGFVIVDNSFQGLGIGKQLMMSVLEQLDTVRIQLHATKMGEGLYARLGFVPAGTIYQYQTASLLPLVSARSISDLHFREAKVTDLSQLVAYDFIANEMERSTLFAHLIHKQQIWIAEGKTGEFRGFAARRLFGRGWVIGPVIAQDSRDAQAIMSYLLAPLVGQFVRIDTAAKAELNHWLLSQGFIEADAPVTMIKGEIPSDRHVDTQTFALMTQAMS